MNTPCVEGFAVISVVDACSGVGISSVGVAYSPEIRQINSKGERVATVTFAARVTALRVCVFLLPFLVGFPAAVSAPAQTLSVQALAGLDQEIEATMKAFDLPSASIAIVKEGNLRSGFPP